MAEINFATETLWTGDNLGVMRGINSDCIDLIYLDPPFNSNKTYSAPIGSEAAGASFKDAWTLDDVDVYEHGELADKDPATYSVIEAARQVHGKSMRSYLIFMALRLIEMRRILKETGTIYLHCDTTASHYLKLLMDAVFGKQFFRNEIVWSYKRWPAKHQNFQRMHDILLRYSYSDSVTWNQLFVPLAESTRKSFGTKQQVADFSTGRRKPSQTNAESPGALMRDVWEIPVIAPIAKERTGYPTQKPLALLDRVIKASSNEGDMVLDPFCGCATTLVSAYNLNRKWAGIDLSPLAIKLVKQRINQVKSKLNYKSPTWWKGPIALDEAPKRTDLANVPNYRTHRHHLYGKQEGLCAACDTHFPFNIMDVDHVLPKSKGGTDLLENLQILCSGCNRSKGSKTMAQWRAAQASVR